MAFNLVYFDDLCSNHLENNASIHISKILCFISLQSWTKPGLKENQPGVQCCGSGSGIRCIFTPRIRDDIFSGSPILTMSQIQNIFKILPLKMAKNRTY
jgi:hypothetical protein